MELQLYTLAHCMCTIGHTAGNSLQYYNLPPEEKNNDSPGIWSNCPQKRWLGWVGGWVGGWGGGGGLDIDLLTPPLSTKERLQPWPMPNMVGNHKHTVLLWFWTREPHPRREVAPWCDIRRHNPCCLGVFKASGNKSGYNPH